MVHAAVFKNGSGAEAPEGGWGYVIMAAVSFVLLVSLSNMSCLGLLYGDFLLDLGMQTKALTLLPSVFMICVSIISIFNKVLFERFSVRSVAIAGAMLFCSGSLMLIFVRSYNELLIAYCVMHGLGFGVIMPAMYTTIVQYFVKRRVMTMALVGAVQGIAAAAMPLFIEKLKQVYGFRGCLAILAAINLHVIFFMIALHPVEWHQKGVVRRKAIQLVPESATLLQSPSRPESPKSSIWKRIVGSLDLTLFLKPGYTNIVLGMSIALCADVTFLTIQPTYLRHISFSTMDAAKIVSIGATADLIARVILSVVSSGVKIQARPLFLAGLIATMLLLMAYQNVTSFIGVAVVTALLGLFRSWFHVTVSIVYADYLPAERFPSGYGLYVFVQGFCALPFGLLFGWVRDATGSYLITFNLLTLAIALCVVPWSIEMAYTRWWRGHSPNAIEAGDAKNVFEENV